MKNSTTNKNVNQIFEPGSVYESSVKQNSINILTTNAAGLKHKASDLKNKVKYLKSSLFSVQETHYAKKGKFCMEKYIIFEAIRKSKVKGGSMLGVHADLNPVLVKEYSEEFELIVVEINSGDTHIRVITGYGPQENWDETKRTPFFEALESEIVCAELDGRSVIISMDANSKLGPKYIEQDPHAQSQNGKLLADVMNRHALTVVNGLKEKCVGAITREKCTVEGVERSVIDFVITSSDLVKHIQSMHIDEKRTHVLTKLIKTKKGKIKHTKKVESDHNVIETKLNIPWKTKADKPLEVFNFKDKLSQDKFQKLTSETNHLTKVFDTDKKNLKYKQRSSYGV